MTAGKHQDYNTAVQVHFQNTAAQPTLGEMLRISLYPGVLGLKMGETYTSTGRRNNCKHMQYLCGRVTGRRKNMALKYIFEKYLVG